MTEPRAQNFSNHAKFDPLFHFILAPVFLGCFIAAIVFLARRPTAFHLWLVIFSLGVFLLCAKCRLYALKVQDRVIRLEERLRLASLLPEGLKQRIPELTERQLIALRFASDAEVPALVERALNEKLEPKAIKQAIRSWRPDHWRV